MAFGAFGKMPSVGDFFRLGTPAGFVSVWDDWVQHVMLDSQSRLGAGWDAHYMSAPVWRFSLSAGLAGAQPVVGVFMPSVDRVGRRFPLTLMAPQGPGGEVIRDHFCLDALFDMLETLALDALDDDMTRDGLALRLTTLPAPDIAPATAPCEETCAVAICAPAGVGVLPALAAQTLAGKAARPSVWSTTVADTERLLLCDGLPTGAQAAALFDMGTPLWRQAVPA